MRTLANSSKRGAIEISRATRADTKFCERYLNVLFVFDFSFLVYCCFIIYLFIYLFIFYFVLEGTPNTRNKDLTSTGMVRLSSLLD